MLIADRENAKRELDGKVAIVTGGSRGIGRAICRRLAQVGAHVVVNYVNAKDQAESVVRDVESFAVQAISVRADVGHAAEVHAMLETTCRRFGKVDILVNNAGVVKNSFITQMSEENWDQVIRTNLKGVFLCTQAAARMMIRQRVPGCIVNVASISAFKATIAQGNYAAAKGGVVAFTRSVAIELARSGIRVNAVAPGGTDTDMMQQAGRGAIEKYRARNPLGDMATPEDIAEVVYFLVSPSAKHIVGHVVCVDGGMSL